MSGKYVELILFYLFAVSPVIIVSGLNFESVSGTDHISRTSPSGDNASSSSDQRELGDTLEIICSNLRIRDLMNAGSVCKEWHNAALREMLNRGLEGAVIPHIYSSEILDVNSNFHVTHVLRTKPYLAILFAGPTAAERNIPEPRSLEYDILEVYRRFFPQYLVTLGVHVAMLDEKIITSAPGVFGPPNGILGLFVPIYKDLDIKFSQCSIANPIHITRCIREILDGLMPVQSNKNTALIMFGSSYLSLFTARQLFPLVRERYVQKRYTLWGGVFTDNLKAIDSRVANRINRYETTFFAISLTGSNLKSWSTIIDCALGKSEFDKKLLELKSNIIEKSNTIGLAYGPRYVMDPRGNRIENGYEDNVQIMKAIKKVFPNIPFYAVFNSGNHRNFGVNSMIDDNNQVLHQLMGLSLMILTHD